MKMPVEVRLESTRFFMILASILLPLCLGPNLSTAQTAAVGIAAPDVPKELVIGTLSAPPFAMKDSGGHWDGLSVDLWRRVAERLGWKYRFQEVPLKDMVDKVASGELDGAMAALTVTPERQKLVDFTQPFYTTGLDVAVAHKAGGGFSLLGDISTPNLIAGALGVLTVLGLMGLIVWLIERRYNEGFGNHRKGLRSSILWAAMTAAGSGADDKPRTFPGQLIMLFWTLTSVILISSLTGFIASSLTASKLQLQIQDVSDLRKTRNGTVQGSAPQTYLAQQGIASAGYPDLRSAMRALEVGQLDAVVHDRPILVWVIKQDFPTTISALGLLFDRQHYAMALPLSSPLRLSINQAMAEELRGDWWRKSLEREFGEK